MENKKFYISTAIAYASSKPHIGNTYEVVLADVIARYKRLCGYDVYFQTGTDEHGQKIEEKAVAEGINPQEYVDEKSNLIKEIWDVMNTSYDKFVRTTDKDHKKLVQDIFKKLYDQGDIYLSEYKGLYCTPCESFWTESQLVDGKCPDCGREVKESTEEAYFFKMSKYSKWLEEYIETHPDFIEPESRKNEIMNNFIKPGLQDLCVSRTSFKWGVPVNFNDKHVVYVWIDALSNYITFLGYQVDGESGLEYKKYWPADVHLIGKDILRFHTIYWPIFLMALGEPLPKQVFGHPWLLAAGDKMSKSKGNVIYADDLARLFGVDAVRYFVLHEMPFDNDGQISWELVTERFNADLANVLGNLVSRTIAMIGKYFGGTVVKPAVGSEQEPDNEFKATVTSTVGKVIAKADALRIADAITEIFNLFRRANKYIDETMPWALAKDEGQKQRLNDVLYNLAEAIQIGASLLDSFMPSSSEKILSAFGGESRALEDCATFGIPQSVTATAIPPLFARLDFKALEPEIEKIRQEQIASYNAENGVPAAAQAEKTNAPKEEEEEKAPTISIDDFAKVELKVGEIIACEKVPKSSKLLHETVKFGNEIRSVVSGIAKHYTPEELVGKKVVFVTNLAPRTVCGVLSEGMILAAEDEDGKLALVVSDKDDLKSGASIH